MFFDVFKEPRGIIRLIQLLFAILAFATTAGYKSTFRFNFQCKANSNASTPSTIINNPRAITLSYPFNLAADSAIEPINCASAGSTVAPGLNYPYGSYTSSAQFYVFVGVIAFLYCIGIIVVYVFFDQVYQDKEFVPQFDFGFTVVWTLFWFIGSVAWAVGVSFLKVETEAGRLWFQITPCLDSGTATCSVVESFGYGGLDISLLCGFANVFLWGASLWFLFKETAWFKRMHPEQAYAGDQGGVGGGPAGSDFGQQQPSGGSSVETGAGIH